jgi:hypothetical protein
MEKNESGNPDADIDLRYSWQVWKSRQVSGFPDRFLVVWKSRQLSGYPDLSWWSGNPDHKTWSGNPDEEKVSGNPDKMSKNRKMDVKREVWISRLRSGYPDQNLPPPEPPKLFSRHLTQSVGGFFEVL